MSAPGRRTPGNNGLSPDRSRQETSGRSVASTILRSVTAVTPSLSSGGKPALVGLAAGGCFALSAIGYRGAILKLEDSNYLMAATFTMAIGLVVQSALLSGYLAWRDRAVLAAISRAWKPSLFAGFMGALATQFWFLAFALATAASVRTLALVEVLFAQAISRFVFHQPVSRREGVGISLILAGVLLLVWT
jgi:drug/metabolite transporter (DMT)-like permease